MGAWIETWRQYHLAQGHKVASYMGAWIETILQTHLKNKHYVASYMGAWIETLSRSKKLSPNLSRILHGCVD